MLSDHCEQDIQLSVIIPVLNESRRVSDAVGAARQLDPFDIVVVDGGSDDRTCEICRSLDCTLVESERGRGQQMNAGAAAARGDVLLFLHVDNQLAAGATSQLAKALADETVQVGGFRQHINSDASIYRWIERGNAYRLRRRGVGFGDQGLFMRRTFFDALGGFPDMPIMEDLVFMKRARRVSKPVLLNGPLHVSARRWQQHGVVRQTLRNWYLQTALALGAPVERLAKQYPPSPD